MNLLVIKLIAINVNKTECEARQFGACDSPKKVSLLQKGVPAGRGI